MSIASGDKRSAGGAAAGVLALGLLAVGCAAPTVRLPATIEAETHKLAIPVVRAYWERMHRLDRIAWPLLTANAELCPRTTRLAGFHYLSLQEIPSTFKEPIYQKAAVEVFKLREGRVVVTDIIPGSPAHDSELRVGDAIVGIEGRSILKLVFRDKGISRYASPKLRARLRRAAVGGIFNKALNRASKDGAIELQVARGDDDAELVNIEIGRLVEACDYPIVLVEHDEAGAYADGRNIYLTTGMLEFASTDEELLTVIAHELAHNAEDHIDKKRTNATLGTLAGALAGTALTVATQTYDQGLSTDLANVGAAHGALAYSRDFEREADYVGVYYMERAGIDTAGAKAFWRRISAGEGAIESTMYNVTHPTTLERYVTISETVDEVRGKRENGEELLPSRK